MLLEIGLLKRQKQKQSRTKDVINYVALMAIFIIFLIITVILIIIKIPRCPKKKRFSQRKK